MKTSNDNWFQILSYVLAMASALATWFDMTTAAALGIQAVAFALWAIREAIVETRKEGKQ